MKPLVLWCRWHEGRLRLMGRDQESVWGEIAFADETKPFQYKIQTRQLTIGHGSTARLLQLDVMGVELPGTQ